MRSMKGPGMIGILILMVSQSAYSQSTSTGERKLEVGFHVAILNNQVSESLELPVPSCAVSPCLSSFTVSGSRQVQAGLGGRIGYNFKSYLAVEAELNFFPRSGSFGQPEAFRGGHKIEGLFGVKAGKRFSKVGIFGKGRPGFVMDSKGDLQPIPGTLCVAIFPPPAGCFQPISRTNFAFDVGGVIEIYPTRRTLIRFDAGDLVVRLGDRKVSGLLSSSAALFPSRLVVSDVPAQTTHNLQVSAGVGFRF